MRRNPCRCLEHNGPTRVKRPKRLVNEHLGEYQNVTAASVVVAGQLGVSRESMRRWVAGASA